MAKSIFFAFGVAGKLDEGGGDNGGGRSVTRGVRDGGVVEIPVRYKVLRKLREVDIRYFAGEVEVFPVLCKPVAHGVAVDAPRLAAGPHGAV